MRRTAGSLASFLSAAAALLVGAFLVFFLGAGIVNLVELIENANLSPTAFLVLVMVVVFIAGFFIDFIEIIFIIVPVVAPIFELFEFDLIWIGLDLD